MKTYTEYVNEQRMLNEESKLQKEYQEFFNALLKKYEVDSPKDLDEEQSKKFFDEISKGWTKGEGVTDAGQKVLDEHGK